MTFSQIENLNILDMDAHLKAKGLKTLLQDMQKFKSDYPRCYERLNILVDKQNKSVSKRLLKNNLIYSFKGEK
ncbi:hypothetical protein CMI37_32910 [Candidatus Pacearchaeota archaeon]|nr:hypothetical protein [Candidatus Pacearchaeota archaeon]|tara:strand:- start:390 stop:608 length:219 start_codon:yes stop_codon:yes gene_type:complete